MIPIKLKLSNFTSYGENPPELDFTKFKLAAISGLNGAGKSSLLDSITWCLWGSSRAGESSDSLMHSGADDMSVQFSFDLYGNTFTVKRRRSHKRGGSTALELWSDSHNLTEGTIKATQEKIINILHLTFETFTNSAYLRQGHADEFTTKGPTDRKRILADILGLNYYDRLEEKAKDSAKEVQTKLQLLQYQLLEIEAELSQKEESQNKLKLAEEKISELEKQLNQAENQLQSLREQKEKLNITNEQRSKLQESYKQSQQELEEILSQGKKKAERIQILEQQIKILPDIEKKLANLKDVRRKKEELDAQIQKSLEIKGQITKLQGDLAIKNQKLEHLQKELAKIEGQLKQLGVKGARCPTCGQEIGREHKAKVERQLSENKSDIDKEIKKIDTSLEMQEIKKYQQILQKLPPDEGYPKITQELKQLESLQNQKEILLQQKAESETERKNVIELRVFYKNKLAAIQNLEKEINKLPDVTQKLNQINDEAAQKEAALANLKNEEKEARSIFGQVKELISRTQQLEKLQQTKRTDQQRLENEKQIFEELGLAFGKKGIQAMIIEVAIPEIEDEANRLLDRVTEGRMRVSLQTQRETKTKLESGEKGIIETLDIIISDEMGERPYEMYSGGEAFRVNFALRLAISKLLTNRAGAKLQFLVIDEGFGSQDAPGRARLIEAIDAIKNDFEKILIVTHIEELKEEFPVRIEVTKEATGSIFKVVGI